MFVARRARPALRPKRVPVDKHRAVALVRVFVRGPSQPGLGVSWHAARLRAAQAQTRRRAASDCVLRREFHRADEKFPPPSPCLQRDSQGCGHCRSHCPTHCLIGGRKQFRRAKSLPAAVARRSPAAGRLGDVALIGAPWLQPGWDLTLYARLSDHGMASEAPHRRFGPRQFGRCAPAPRQFGDSAIRLSSTWPSATLVIPCDLS